MANDTEIIRELVKKLNAAENSLAVLGLDAMIQAFDEILGDDWQGAANGGAYHDRAAEREAEKALFTAFPDYHRSIDVIIVEPPMAAFQWTFTGTHAKDFAGIPASNNRVSVSGVSIVEHKNGKLHRSHQFVDVGAFLSQLQTPRLQP